MKGTIDISMKTKFLVLVITTILFLSIATLVGAVMTINKISDDNISNYKKDVYVKTQKELQNYVQVTLKTIESFYSRTSKDKIEGEVQNHLNEQMGLLFTIINEQYKVNSNKLSLEDLKEHIKTIIKSVRYGENGYFWINDLKQVMIMHPIQTKLDNQDLTSWKDENGKYIFQEFVKVSKTSGEGFIDYVWPKPGFEKPQNKVSLVKLFKPFDWVVGTGEYVEDVTKKLQLEAIKTISEIRYGDSGYFWINDTHPKMIMHPIQPKLNGTDLTNIKDEDGQFLFREFVTLTNEKKDGGIIKYMWPKPGYKDAQPKFSFVQKFEPWNWIVGTGAYVDDVEEKVQRMKSKTEKSINIIVIASAVIFIIVLVVLSLITLAISTKQDGRRV